jgi:hypothetical protein
MKKIIFLVMSLVSFTAFSATTYKLDMSLALNGKTVGQPKLTVEEGKKALVVYKNDNTPSKNEIEILATESVLKGKKGINLKLKITQVFKNKRTVISKPEVFVYDGKEAIFRTTDDQANETMNLKVLVQKASI